MHNTLNWFEIFVADLPRAQAFYEAVLDTSLKTEDFGGMPMAVFPAEGLKGALVKHPRRQPSAEGAITYLNCNGRLDQALARVPAAGGAVLMPRTDIGAPGFIAWVRDTEGNTVALHAARS
jgi:predicted enzyme related to lactoylglutathione lyase